MGNDAFTVIRWLPLVAVVVFLVVGTAVRSVVQRRRYGSFGITVVGRPDQHPSLIERGAIVLPVVLLAEATVASTPAGYDALTSLATPSWRPALAVLGFATMLGGTAAMFVAQLAMGASWRIGIDRRENPGLVMSGPYRFTRNPIYLCMFLVLAGLVVMLPGWLTLLTLVSTVVGVRIAVAWEEAHLAAIYGGVYQAYTKRVGRFLPRLRRAA
jgi:protein-S-isoprenylcysteine O-methyltransferase Ste14